MQNGMVLLAVSSYLQEVVLGAALVIAVTYDTPVAACPTEDPAFGRAACACLKGRAGRFPG